MANSYGTPPFLPTATPAPEPAIGGISVLSKLLGRMDSPGAQLGLRILANNRGGASFGNVLGGSVLQQQAQAGAQQEEDLKRRYMEAQIRKMGLPDPQAQSAPVIVQGPDGKPRYATREEAIGQTPWTPPAGETQQVGGLQEFGQAQKDGFKGDYISFLKAKAIAQQQAPQEPLIAIQTPDGRSVLVPRSQAVGASPAAPRENFTPTEGERKSAALGTRLESSMRELNAIEGKNPGSSAPTLLERGARVFGETAANTTRSPDRQQANAAQLDALDAALTLATGAAYTREQLEGMRTSYFPQLMDSEATKAAKRKRFETIVETARIAAGRAAPNIDTVISGGRGGQGTQAAPASDPLGLFK